MSVARLIKQAQKAGWCVAASQNRTMSLSCACHGCKGAHIVSTTDCDQVIEPCSLKHQAGHSEAAYEDYKSVVSELACRRKQLGLSQEDLGAAAGFADGHVNKLEAFSRTAQLPTLQLWAGTLGLKMTLAPAPIPPATLRAIDQRTAPLRVRRSDKTAPLQIEAAPSHVQ